MFSNSEALARLLRLSFFRCPCEGFGDRRCVMCTDCTPLRPIKHEMNCIPIKETFKEHCQNRTVVLVFVMF